MLKTVPNLLAVFVLLIGALACVTPGVTTPDPNFISTAIAQTYAVAASQTAQFLVPVTGQESATPTRAASATPFPTYTLVVLVTPEIRVSVNSNCRTGPGNVYSMVGVLQVDEVAQVVGRSADGSYWAIRNPDRPGEVCWISDEDATITGFTNLLPVFTPAPTPTPTLTRTPVPATSAPIRTRTPVPTSPPAPAPTQTSTPPLTPVVSSTFTFTPTGLVSPAPTASSTSTPTPSATSTEMSALSPTPTGTSTPSQTPTASSTSTPTPSATSTEMSALSPTPTSTSTASQTPTPSSTPTSTPSPTPTSTSTPSPTPTASFTATSTPSQTLTSTPSPTGTLVPAFTAAYSGMESCPGTGWWLEFQVNNTGPASFDFMALFVTDTVTGTMRPLYSPDFTNRNGCGTATTLDTFAPGVTHTVSSAIFPYNPSGHRLNARIILCANPGSSGICITQTVDFTP